MERNQSVSFVPTVSSVVPPTVSSVVSPTVSDTVLATVSVLPTASATGAGKSK